MKGDRMKVMLHPSLNQGGTTKRTRPSSLSRGGGFSIFRMLKQVSGGVLGEETSSTYLRGYASGASFACGLAGRPV